MIPLSRFNEVNEKAKQLETRLAQIEADQKAATERTLLEQKKFQELAESRGADLVKAQAEASKVTEYETTLKDVLKSQIEGLPEEKRSLVPEQLTTAQQLSWLAKNAAILKAPNAPDLGAGRGNGGQPPRIELTAEEHAVAQKFGMTDVEYVKNR